MYYIVLISIISFFGIHILSFCGLLVYRIRQEELAGYSDDDSV